MEAIPVTAAPSPAPALDTETLYRAVIGPKHTDYFLQYFARRDAGGRFWSWNWPAFFVALLWSLYRKAWGFALGSIALTFVAAWTFGIIAGIVVAGILAGILVPAYNDYVKRANAKAASLIIGSPFAVRRV